MAINPSGAAHRPRCVWAAPECDLLTGSLFSLRLLSAGVWRKLPPPLSHVLVLISPIRHFLVLSRVSGGGCRLGAPGAPSSSALHPSSSRLAAPLLSDLPPTRAPWPCRFAVKKSETGDPCSCHAASHLTDHIAPVMCRVSALGPEPQGQLPTEST